MSPPGSPLALLTVLTSSGQPIFTSKALQLSVVHSHEPETISTMLNMRLFEALLGAGAPLPSGQSSYFKASCFWAELLFSCASQSVVAVWPIDLDERKESTPCRLEQASSTLPGCQGAHRTSSHWRLEEQHVVEGLQSQAQGADLFER